MHNAMINCMVVPYEDPDEWFFKQFPSRSAMEQFALENNLVMKWPENGA